MLLVDDLVKLTEQVNILFLAAAQSLESPATLKYPLSASPSYSAIAYGDSSFSISIAEFMSV